MQQQNDTIQQQNEYFQTEVLRRLSEQQQHLMQQPVGQSSPQQTAAQMQQSQMLQQQLQQYENFQTEVMRRLSDVGADSPPLDTTAVRKDVSFQGEVGFAKFLQAQHLKMTETTKYHQTKNAKMHNSQAEESTIQLAKHHRDDGGSDTEEQGDGLQLRVFLKWHICFFMKRISDM